jgi:ferric-dicitrate binding protein FerR (iron transport regulator)
MNISEAIKWTERLASGAYSQEEMEEFLAAVQSLERKELSQVLDAYYTALNKLGAHPLHVAPDFMDRLKALKPLAETTAGRANRVRNMHYRKWFYGAAAAVSLFAIAGITYLSLHKKAATPALAVSGKKLIAPGSNKAMLILGDGTSIELAAAKPGDIARQGDYKIIKLDSSVLSYHRSNPASATGDGKIVYNTISTPRGGQYQVILPDGTHVWLNSASSLKFPTTFTGKSRQVALSGEAYFEVTKNKSIPFIASVGNMQVNVLGTHFNIMAYTDEAAIKTTLLEGSVKLVNGKNSALIKPGEQGSLGKETDGFRVSTANIDEVMAWKEGKLRFDEMDIHAIMRQIARWYDVEITYAGDLSGINLSGAIPRKEYASELLKALEMTQRVQFDMQGNKIIVKPYHEQPSK